MPKDLYLSRFMHYLEQMSEITDRYQISVNDCGFRHTCRMKTIAKCSFAAKKLTNFPQTRITEMIRIYVIADTALLGQFTSFIQQAGGFKKEQ